MVLCWIWLWNTAPSPAMPVAMPTWRKVLFAPDAMPLRSGGTTLIAAEARTGFTVPIPMPVTMNPGSRTVQPDEAWTWDMRNRPMATISRPLPSR